MAKKIRWFYHHKDIGKQINMNMFGGTLGIALYVLLGFFDNPASRILQAILFFHIAYIFVEVILLARKWADRAYR